MSSLFVSLPAPANASGPAVDVSAFGSTKTITVAGSGGATVTIEVSSDAGHTKWAPLGSFRNPGEKTFEVACAWMRVTSSNGGGGSVEVGGSSDGTEFAALTAPATDIAGPAVDVSELGLFKTVQVGGPFAGAINVEISEDGGTTWQTAFSFSQPGIQSQTIAADFMRVSRSGSKGSGTPLVNVAGTSPGGGGGSVVPTPPFHVATTVIYARTTGSDVTGNGRSPATAYRTTQRALRDVPNIIPPGQRYIVDNTGIGVEVLPPDFEFPVIANAHAFEIQFTDPSFFIDTGFALRAYPQPVALPGSDGVITTPDLASIAADPDTNLVTITLAAPRASWGSNALKGKFLQGPAFPVVTSAVIWKSTTTTLQLATSGAGANFNFLFLGIATIVEPSATLQGSNVLTTQAINVGDCATLSFDGQKVVNTNVGQANLALNLNGNSGYQFLLLCDVAGLGGRVQENLIQLGSYIHDKNLDFSGAGMLSVGVFFENIPSFPEMGDFPVNWAVSGCVFDTCPALGARADANILGVGTNGMGMKIQNTWIQNSIADSDGTHTLAPGDGVRSTGGQVALSFVKISGAARNAIYAADSNGYTDLTHVTGGSGVGTDTVNAGYGIFANDGSVVHIHDAATDVTGTLGPVKSGSLAAQTYANVAAGLSYDIPNNAASAQVATGTRIYLQA